MRDDGEHGAVPPERGDRGEAGGPAPEAGSAETRDSVGERSDGGERRPGSPEPGNRGHDAGPAPEARSTTPGTGPASAGEPAAGEERRSGAGSAGPGAGGGEAHPGAAGGDGSPRRRSLPAETAAALAHAVTFLTRIPLPVAYRRDRLERGTAFFPLAGLLVGGLAALAYLGSAELWAGWVPLVVALAVPVVLTGALHEDGLADCFDALGAGPDPERRRAALKDSRLGTFGALALLAALGLKLGALGLLAPWQVVGALVTAHAWSRWSITAVLWRTEYASGEGGIGAALATGSTGGRAALATGLALVVGGVALGWASLVVATVVVVVVAVQVAYWKRALGGVNGDVLGAVCQGVEVAVYLVLPLLPAGWFPYR